jgi:RNA 2',3'-cyclic 3'-phosphodiesterase
MAALGYPEDGKPFSPHLTLARVKQPDGLESLTARLQAQAVLPCLPFAVDAFTLYKSDLRPSGAIYTAMHRTNLQLGG